MTKHAHPRLSRETSRGTHAFVLSRMLRQNSHLLLYLRSCKEHRGKTSAHAHIFHILLVNLCSMSDQFVLIVSTKVGLYFKPFRIDIY